MHYEFENLHEISKDEFLKLNEDDVLFITHPGRMLDEDGSTFVIKKDDNYIVYRISGWYMGDKGNPDFISHKEFLKQFPIFDRNLHDESLNDYEYINMCFGNALFVKHDIYKEFKRYLDRTLKFYSTQEDYEDFSESAIIFRAWDQALIDMAQDKGVKFL